jgi:hypothetical protein
MDVKDIPPSMIPTSGRMDFPIEVQTSIARVRVRLKDALKFSKMSLWVDAFAIR